MKGPGEEIKAQVLERTDRKAGGRHVGWISNKLLGSGGAHWVLEGGGKVGMKWLQNIAWNIDRSICVCMCREIHRERDRRRDRESQLHQKKEN